MSLLDKFKDQFVDRDEDEREEDLGEEEAPVNPSAPVPPRPSAVSPARGIGRSAQPRQAAKPYTMVVVNPKSYGDAEKIGDHLKAMRPVVIKSFK